MLWNQHGCVIIAGWNMLSATLDEYVISMCAIILN